MLNDVNIANCGSGLPRITHILFDPAAEREHPQPNFSTLLGGLAALAILATALFGAVLITPASAEAPTAPAITSADRATFAVGSAGSFTVASSGFPTPALSTRGVLPAGLSFTDNADGTATIAGTAAAGIGGVYRLTFTASNGVNPDATQEFTLTVTQSSAITSADRATFAVGSAGSFTVTSSGFPTPALSTRGVLPAGLSFTDNADGTATIAGTAAAGTGGVYRLTFTASNGVNPDATQEFTLNVLYGFGGFMSPVPNSELRAGARIPVKFALTNGPGQPISATLAAALASAGKVRATLAAGPGTNAITPVTASCKWNRAGLYFQCNIKTTRRLQTGTRHPYTITVFVNLGGGFLAAPGGGNPATIYFK